MIKKAFYFATAFFVVAAIRWICGMLGLEEWVFGCLVLLFYKDLSRAMA